MTATTSFQTANIPVRVTGIAMFDFPHGQTGAAPNQIELHPLIDIIFNPTCTYSPSDLNPFFDESAHQSAINVTASGACPWMATSNADWITIESAEHGYGKGSVVYMVRENTTASARQGTLTVAANTSFRGRVGAIRIGSQTLTIKQKGQ